jgi:glycosyltransferase involved in cell wall biosynthesis
LSEQKGFGDLIDAVAGLAGRFPNLTVAIAGEGPLRESLLARGRTLGAARLFLLGMQNDVRPVLEAGDVFVLPSLWEAMPYALLEAMAMGVPVVGTTVAGVPDVIEGGRSGLLVPPQDVSSLRDAIQALLTDRALREEMGREARLRIENSFSERQMLRSTLQVYREMLRQS